MPAPSRPWAVVVPVKGGSSAKSRLADPARPALATAFALDTIMAALATVGVERVVVVTSDPVVATVVRALDPGDRVVDLVPDPGVGLDAAARAGVDRARAEHFHRVAVLLGGATYLLPVFAQDILHVGAREFGWLRAAPAVGSLAMAMYLTHRPPMRHAGRAMLWAVAGFGVAVVVFGLSRNLWLSIFALFITGLVDNISVVVRQTLVQVLTPDHMRGRVSAVNTVFIGASNELGGFESGLTARLFGPIISVVAGGLGAVLTTAFVAWKWPQVRAIGALHEVRPDESEPAPAREAA